MRFKHFTITGIRRTPAVICGKEKQYIHSHENRAVICTALLGPLAMPESVELKMAKASKEDIGHMRKLIQFIEMWFEYGETMVGDNDSIGINQDQFVELLEKHWKGRAELGAFRVIEGCDILIDNCCDPDKTHLDFRPDLAKALAESS